MKSEYFDDKRDLDNKFIFPKSFYNLVKYETTFDNKTPSLNINLPIKP